jgi:hypothetical protein
MSTRFAYKELPKFEPKYYRQWARVVGDAFAERDWNDYLITPSPVIATSTGTDGITTTTSTSFNPDATITVRAKAFLSQSIEFRYQPSIETCETAAEIWSVFLQRYGQRSRDDELRLEAELLSLIKLSTETLDEYIEKFDNIISSIRAQQEPSQRWDDSKVNMHFIRTLELSNIKNEDWKAWSTYLGSTHLSMTHDSLLSACRTYYATHMLPLLALQPQEYAYRGSTSPAQNTNTSQSQTPSSGRGQGRGKETRGNNRGRGGRGGGTRGGRGGGGGGGDTRRNLPRDPHAWCVHCEMQGHAVVYCYSKYKDTAPDMSFNDWCASQSSTPPPYSQSQSQSQSSAFTAPTAPPSTRNPGPRQPAKEHGRSYTVRSCRCLSGSTKDTWIYDTACTEHMTDESTFFSTYDTFRTPVDVHGINGLLQAVGQGDVVVADPQGHTHTLLDVWYVPGLNDSIISKHWTRHSGLQTSMDANENFHLRSPTSPFHISSTTVDKISIISNLRVVEYSSTPPTTVRVTITTPDPPVPAPDQPAPVPPTSDPDPAPAPAPTPYLIYIPKNVPPQLMHQRLGHASAERMRLIGLAYNLAKCHACIMGKQTTKPFPRNPHPRSTRKLFRVFSDLCPVSPETFGHGLYFITFVDEATRYVWIYIIPSKSSATVLAILRKWLPLVQNQSGTTLVNFRTDEGGEYTGETLKTVTTFLEERGITHEPTSAYSSSSNGVAERMNRTLMDMVRTMMITSNLPAPFWGEAVHTAAKIRNRLPTSSLDGNISPHEAWYGTPPSLHQLRVFGCLAFYKIKHPKTKVLSRSKRCCLLGYDGNTQFRVYDPATNKVLSKIRNIDFIENEFLEPGEFARVPYADRPLLVPEPRTYGDEDEDPELTDAELAEIDWEDPVPELVPDIKIPRPAYMPIPPGRQDLTGARRPEPHWPIPPPPRPSADSSDDSDSDMPPLMQTAPASPVVSQHSSPAASQHASPEASRPPTPDGARRSARPPKPTERKLEGDAQARKRAPAASKTLVSYSKAFATHTGPTLHSSSPHYVASYAPPNEPRSLQEAMASPFAAQWTAAILEELGSLDKYGTYSIVPRPRGRRVVGSRFAFKIKDAETLDPRFKVRFVARGFTQVHHVDYEDTFAPVVKATSVRLLLAHAAGNRLLVNKFDVETAFLNSVIDRTIYIEQPVGFEHPDFPRDKFVLQVNKGLYGLKQSGSLYAEDQKKKLMDLGFVPSEADECVFLSADKRITVATYVDDGLVSAEEQSEIDWVISELNKHYTVRNLGAPTKFLGLDIHRPDPRGPITVSQGTYARKLLAKFEMQDCNSVKSPCDQRAAYLHLRTETESPADAALYRSMTSSVMHLGIWTRPDICWIANKLCQFNRDPSDLHMAAAKHLLRYIQGTLDYAFTYAPSEHNSLYGLFADFEDFSFTPLHGYADSSGASDPDDRRSTSGIVFFYYGGVIVWESNKQTYAVALSSMEGEYLALTEAAKIALFLRNLLASINIPQEQPTLILTDSDAALKHVKNNVNHPRTKHIDTRHHFIRHAYLSRDVDIRHIPAASQAADILTKPLGTIKHLEAVKLLQLHDSRYT